MAPAICPGSSVLLGLETQSLQAAASDCRVTLRAPPSPTLPWLRDMGHTGMLCCLAFLPIFGCSPISGDKKEPGLDLSRSPGSQSREQELLQGQGPGVPATVDGEKKAPRAWYPKGESERRAMHQKHKRKRRQHSKPEDGKPV